MTTINRDELDYINTMMALAVKRDLPSNTFCPECSTSLYDRDRFNRLQFDRDEHTIIDTGDDHIVIIGCEGFHIFDPDGMRRSLEG